VRLTQVKLSGFKSFVDPTSIHVPGQLVGIVGPNGCGKSNVIDAVRWVLGESRASALRGESMQDVIFNGSIQRKPVARASVELVFDNTLGRAAGQWSQYAEISVKRVLQRDGESGYYINNTPVRRRDIQDIFLGTGVGPRAYAIIEQGMISRVIEAKPEELRVFLEEAAGISKYTERRRETEARLEDTRENLARVSDIQRELDAQIEKLAQQAEVARTFTTLRTEQTRKQQMLWWLRRQESEQETARISADIERMANEVEAGTATLRDVERRLEQTRASHYEAVDSTNAIQGEFYAVNGDISNLESELRHIGETRQRLMSQGAQLVGQLDRWGRQPFELGEALDMWDGRLRTLGTDAETASARLGEAEAGIEGHEQAVRSAQAEVANARAAIAEAERTLQVEETRRLGALRMAEQGDARVIRLRGERDALPQADATLVRATEQSLQGLAAQGDRMQADLHVITAGLPAQESARQEAAREVEQLGREISGLQSRLATLKSLHEGRPTEGDLAAWLKRHQLDGAARLWQQVRVEPGWERALEAVLRERLHAVLVDEPALASALAEPAPGARVLVQSDALATGESSQPDSAADASLLAASVSASSPGVAALVRRWCGQVRRLEAAPDAAALVVLPPGSRWVDREGCLYEGGGHSVAFHGGPAGDANVLVRQREIERLAVEVEAGTAALAAARQRLAAGDLALGAARGRVGALQTAIAAGREASHKAELVLTRQRELGERSTLRRTEIERELATLATERARLEETAAGHESIVAAQRVARGEAQQRLQTAQAAQVQAERDLGDRRNALRAAERAAQESRFAVREAESKLAETRRSLTGLIEQIAQATQTERALRVELGALVDGELKRRLQTRLAERSDIESRLARARDTQEGVTAAMREIETERLEAEQRIGPLREAIADLRLKEQAARLAGEQYAQQLSEAEADLAAIEAEVQALSQGGGRGVRLSALQTDINRLSQQMNALGPINMAALDELETGSERKTFLDAQAADLSEALGTLENAIRRIDLETRSLLQKTFDTVNANFSVMFPALFGGGQARLVMTGDEILDAGVQVMAQPPGKKNSSIHLLSGGEKALTATSLIFSLFQLNPAPFCLLDEVDAPLDDANTERFCNLVRQMSKETQFLFISHNKITMELANQLVGVTMQEQGVSRIVAVDMEQALQMREPS
jgi:chromosome segregation protein